MPDSHRTELRDIIDRTYLDLLGGRATQAMVHEKVLSGLPEHMAEYLIGKGLRSEIGTYFRAKRADGLPKYPEVNDAGEHVQLSFAEVDEYAYVYWQYVKAAEASQTQADKVRAECLDAHGVDLLRLPGEGEVAS